LNTQPRRLADLVFAMTGPIVWAAHFFTLYLAEAFACSAQSPGTSGTVRWIGGAATLVAIVAVALFALRIPAPARATDGPSHTVSAFAFAVPLTLLSILAILWSSMPLFLLPACRPAAL
jgi:hypothetical protein